MSDRANEPAYPLPQPTLLESTGPNIDDNRLVRQMDSGMTLREHYAGLAMQGIIAGPATDPLTIGDRESSVVEVAVAVADALLAELAKEGE